VLIMKYVGTYDKLFSFIECIYFKTSQKLNKYSQIISITVVRRKRIYHWPLIS
jgi:hypothetical protein